MIWSLIFGVVLLGFCAGLLAVRFGFEVYLHSGGFGLLTQASKPDQDLTGTTKRDGSTVAHVAFSGGLSLITRRRGTDSGEGVEA